MNRAKKGLAGWGGAMDAGEAPIDMDTSDPEEKA